MKKSLEKQQKLSYSFLWEAIKGVCKTDLIFVILTIVSVALGMALAFYPPLLLIKIVETYIFEGGVISSGLWFNALGYFALLAAFECNMAAQNYFGVRIANKILLNVRTQMANRLEKLPMQFFKTNQTGGIMSYFTSDVDTLENIFSSGMIRLVMNLFQIIGFVASVFVISKNVFFMMLIVFPFLFIMTRVFKKKNIAVQKKLRQSTANMSAYFEETFSSLFPLKLFGRENQTVEKLQPLLHDWYVPMRTSGFLSSAFPVVRQTLWAVTVSLVAFIAGPTGFAFSNGLSAAAIMTLIDLVIKIFYPIEALSSQIFTLQSAMAGIRRIASYFDIATEEKVYTNDVSYETKNPKVTVSNLSFSYNKGEQVLKNISFTVPFGKKIAFAGRTGAGKTTLMNLIAGLYEAESGSVLINGVNPFLMEPEKRRKILGVVSQEPYIMDGTIYENVTMNDSSISKKDVIEAIKLVGLEDDVQKLENSYNTVVGEGRVQLSKGQKQLLCLARAIVTNPKLLLLDELTAGLDMITEKAVLSALKNIAEGRTIITISHRLSGIIDADYVYLLNRGKVVEEGNLQQLNGNQGFYAMMLKIEEKGWQEV